MRSKGKIMILCAALGLSFWQISPVDLLDKKLLIDLDSVIQEADWGKEGLTDSGSIATEESKEESQDVSKEEVADIPIPEPPEVVSEKKVLLAVSVQGERIMLDGREMKDIETLKEHLSEQWDESMLISLEDDYAESHVYREVYGMMSQNFDGFSEVIR